MMIGALARAIAMANRIIVSGLGAIAGGFSVIVSRVGLVSLVGAFAVVGALGVATDAAAERLPIRRFTTADGLAGEYIVSISRDSRGFLWFCTRDGLSRFDGVRFVSYGTLDGLPTATINRVLETRRGVIWIATNGGGLTRFNPTGMRPSTWPQPQQPRDKDKHQPAPDDALFVSYRVAEDAPANRINVLLDDRQGRLWVGTDAGLFVLDADGAGARAGTNGSNGTNRGGSAVRFRAVTLPQSPADPSRHGIGALAEDSDGSLWIGGGFGVRRRLPDGRMVVYRVQDQGAREGVRAMLVVNERHVWVAFRSGLMVLERDPAASFAPARDGEVIVRTLPLTNARSATGERVRWFSTPEGLPHDDITTLYVSRSSARGRLWVGTLQGVAAITEIDGDGSFSASRVDAVYTSANGLFNELVTSIVEDTDGNVWVGGVAGVARIIRHGLVTYDEADGLGRPTITSLAEDAAGRLFAVSFEYGISRFDGTRFVTGRPPLPSDATCVWTSPCGYLDRRGDWWMLTLSGLFRGRGSPDAARGTFTRVSGSPDEAVYKIFEDRRDDVWVGTPAGRIFRWQRSTATWRAFSEADGLPRNLGTPTAPSTFAQSRGGDVWVGLSHNGLVRFRGDRFQVFTTAEGSPPGYITALLFDSTGRLWIGSNEAGLTRVDDPEAPRPTFSSMAANSGLALANVRCVIEDRAGRIYAGTSRGVDRLDPRTGRVRHYGAGDGLASEFVMAAWRDTHGMLWFGTMSGLSRLDPSQDAAPADAHTAAGAEASATSASTAPASPSPGRVLISALRVRGAPQRVSDLGEIEPPALTLSPDQNQLEIEFFEISFNAGESPKYQYRLDGVDADWSPPTEVRSVNYGRLPTGTHRFLVRAVRSDGAVSATPSVVRVTVLPPIYARWWFISLAVIIVSAAALALYRMRVEQLLRVERVRARIATDLHDDIGASLSQIAILAEVARQYPAHDEEPRSGALARIAETSRGLVDSMSDIVWAINPEVDSLSDLVHRMRRFAEDTLSTSDIELTFREPELRQDPRLGPDIRREIFLILKESVTNIAKHAEATRVTIEMESDRRRLRLRVSDDGRGFDPAVETDGNGVANMRRRVAALQGRVSIQSKPQSKQGRRGTTIELEIPLKSASASAVSSPSADDPYRSA